MGDPRAEASYDVFFQTSWARLQGQAYVLTGSQELAQDLTQEALLRAWTHWDRITGYESPEGWTRRVLHNLCIQSWRKSQVRRFDGPREVTTTVDVPEDHVLLAQAMRQLPGGPGPGPATPRWTGNDRRRDRPGARRPRRNREVVAQPNAEDRRRESQSVGAERGREVVRHENTNRRGEGGHCHAGDAELRRATDSTGRSIGAS